MGTGERTRRAALRRAATLILAAAFAGCATGGSVEYALRPASGDGTAVAHDASGVRAAARFLDAPSLEAYVRAQGLDALAPRLRDLKVTAFALAVENGGTQEVLFDPRGIRFSPGGRETYSPLEYTHLYMALPDDSNRKEALSRLPSLLFEGVQSLAPGGVVERMVLFRRPERFERTGVLLLGGVYVKGAPVALAMEFKAGPAR